MAKTANYKIGVGALINASDIQSQLNAIAAKSKPKIKLDVELGGTATEQGKQKIVKYNEEISAAIQKTVLKREYDEARLNATQKTHADWYKKNLSEREAALGKINQQHELEKSKLQQLVGVMNSLKMAEARKTDVENMSANDRFFGYTDPEASRGTAAKSASYFNEVFSGYRRYGAVITDVDQATGKYDEKQRKILEDTAKLNIEVPKSSRSFKGLGDILKNNIAKFAEWTIAATVIMQTLRQIRAAIKYVEDLDKAVTNLQIITGMSEDSARALTKQYNELGREIGATTIQVAEGAEEWIRAGKTAEEALELTRQSLTLSKLSGMSASESTQALIASLNGYKLAASEAASVVDKLIAVDNKAATSAQELATAISYVSSVANISGVSLDRLVGLIGTVSSVTRLSAETVGQGFKSVFSRLGNVKVGKFIDDDGSAINDVEAVLGKVGIKLRENQDEFRDFQDVLDDVGKSWSTFTELEQSAIATALAGTRQRNLLVTAFQNYDEVIRLTTEAEESAGLSAKRMAEYTDSFAGKSAQLQANLEKLYSTMLDSSFLKFVVDLTSGIANFASALGGWTVVVPAAIMLLGAFKKEWAVTQLALGVGDTIINGLVMLFPRLEGAFISASDGLITLTGSATTAKIAMSALATGGILLLLTLLPQLFDWLRNNVEWFDRLFESIKDVSDNVDDLTARVSSLRDEYEKLRAQDELTSDEMKRLNMLNLEIQAQEELLRIEQERLYKKKFGGNAASGLVSAFYGGMPEGKFAYNDGSVGGKVLDTSLPGIEKPENLEIYLDAYQDLNDARKAGVELQQIELEYLKNVDAYLAENSEIVYEKASKEAGAYEKLASAMSGLKAGVAGVSSLYKEMSDNGQISIETVLGLMESGSDLIDLLYVENGVYKLNAKAAEAYYNAKRTATVNGLKLTKAEIEAEIAQAKTIMNTITVMMAKGQLLGSGYAYGIAYSNAKKTVDQMTAALNSYKTIMSAIPGTLSSYTNATNSASTSTGGLSDAVQRQIDLLEKQKDAALSAIDAQINGLQRQLDLLKSQNEETQNQIDLQKALDDLERARNQRNTRVYTSTGWQWVSDAGAVQGAEENLKDVRERMAEKAIQDQIDALERRKEDTSAGYDAQIRNLRGYSDGGLVDFTGPAMLHGSQNNEEYVSNSTETRVLRNMLSKMGGKPSSRMGTGSSGMAYNIYGDIIVNGEDGDSLEAIISRATALARSGK